MAYDNCSSGRSKKLLAVQKKVSMLEAVVENFPGGLLLFDRDLKLVFCNENQKRLLEYPVELFADGPPSIETIFRLNAHRGEYGDGEPEEQVVTRLQLVAQRVEHTFERVRPNGTVLRIKGVPLAGGGFMSTYLDITEEHRNRQNLAYLALHDTVTGLSNRRAFMAELSLRIEGLRIGQAGAVIFIDLNKFKLVNDNFGHASGDELLKLVGNRLRRSIRDGDFLARLGGDEFAILQGEVSSLGDVESLAMRIQSNICEKYVVRDQIVEIGASIGISIFPDHATNSEELVALADNCMYRSKADKTSFTLWPLPEAVPRTKTRAERRNDLDQLEETLRTYVRSGVLRHKLDPQKRS